jgi:hypothetical protein
MIVLSYITKKFFEELLDKPLDEKKYEHLNDLIKNSMFFFIGNKKRYREILKNKKKILESDNKKFIFIKQLLANASWINVPIDFNNLQSFFKYLNKKNINLDFIYCSDAERKSKIGEIKYLKKSTMNKVISPDRILKENQKILEYINKIIESPHSITYKPREKFDNVAEKSEFKKWHKNLNKLIFVSDEVLIYDRYIFQNFIYIDRNKLLFNRQSSHFCKTLEFLSKSFVKSFVSKNDFNCKIMCVFPPETTLKKQRSHEIIKMSENWDYLKNEIKKFINLNPTKTSISIKDWKLWNKVHERYWRFYKGGNMIKVLKFNPGFDFIKEMNYDFNKDKEYEFDNVRKLDLFKKEKKFQELLNGKNEMFEQKMA